MVDLPIENGGSFHSFVYVDQRVDFLCLGLIDLWPLADPMFPGTPGIDIIYTIDRYTIIYTYINTLCM